MRTQKITVLEARPDSIGARLLSLRQYRSFYGFLFWEITMKKFRDTFFGFWWLVLRPMISATVFIFLFSSVRPIASGNGDPPYAVFFLVGFLTWNLFHATIIFMPRTLLWMQGIMRRTYFPRLLIPLAGFGPPLIEFLVLFSALVIAVAYFWFSQGVLPIRLGVELFMLPVCFVFALMFGIAVGMIASVVALFFRDIVFSMSYIAQMAMFMTPVIYPGKMIPDAYQWILYGINPIAILIEIARWSVFGTGEIKWLFFAWSTLSISFFFAAAILFFLRAEPFFSDQM